MRAERSRQAVRHGSGVGAVERLTVRYPSCQPNHWRGTAPPCVQPMRLGSDSLRTNRTHPDSEAATGRDRVRDSGTTTGTVV